jgi:hypothetical protein
LELLNSLGEPSSIGKGQREVAYQPWMQQQLPPLELTAPDREGVGLLSFEVRTAAGAVLSRNFMFLIVHSDTPVPGVGRVSLAPREYAAADWSGRTWEVLGGKKVNGAGNGFFEYRFRLPDDLGPEKAGSVYFLAELSAKELFVKDREQYETDQDFMKGSRVAPSSNPNSYPMTDETLFPTEIAVSVNGVAMATALLQDDPADHRGVLSWHYQLRDGKLREAGSYGYLVKVPLSEEVVQSALNGDRTLTVRLEATGQGGLAVYGRQFGRYALDPGLVYQK